MMCSFSQKKNRCVLYALTPWAKKDHAGSKKVNNCHFFSMRYLHALLTCGLDTILVPHADRLISLRSLAEKKRQIFYLHALIPPI